MKIVFGPPAWSDYMHWQEHDRALILKIHELIKDICRSPFRGLGKPEPLRDNLAGWWSRRISGEHRLVYRVAGTGDDQRVEISSCRFHYRR